VGRSEIEWCILQFADDTLFICEDSYANIFTIKFILRCYELASGLKINFHKSNLTAIKVERNYLQTYARTLSCNMMRIKARLSKWKGRCFSLAGRVFLIKSVFTALPLFYLSFFKAPVSVCNKITSIQRRFLWAWGSDHNCISWVKWENVYKPMEEKGLGIKDIKKFNN